MTGQRRQRKRRRFSLFLGLALAAGPTAGATAADPLVVDTTTGLALSGFDPVAYFIDGKAVPGGAANEVTRAGAVWRFRDGGTRAAFLAHPEVYTPRFGGYDPMAIGRDRSVPGHPAFWAVVGERLYLFYSEADRAAFMADPGKAIDVAERKWPTVARTIAP